MILFLSSSVKKSSDYPNGNWKGGGWLNGIINILRFPRCRKYGAGANAARVLFNTPRGGEVYSRYRKGKTQLTKWLVIFSQASKLNPFNALIFVAAATEST